MTQVLDQRTMVLVIGMNSRIRSAVCLEIADSWSCWERLSLLIGPVEG